MSGLKKRIIMGSSLLILLIAWLIILIISVGILKVPGFEAIQDVFKPLENQVNYKMFGVVTLFGVSGFLIVYLILLLVMHQFSVSRKITYYLNLTVASLFLAGVVIGILLLVLNF